MKKGLIKNIFSLGIVQIANFAFPVITVLVVSRIIGPDKFGVINFAGAFVTYFTLLINFGFDLSATRVIAANRDNLEERNRIFNQVILAKLLLLGLSIVLFVSSLFLIPQLRQEKAVAIFSFILCFSWVITPTWLYQGMQELSRVAIFNLATKVLSTLVIVLVIRVKSDYVWQPLALSLAQIVVGIYAFFFAIRRYRITLYWAPLKPVLRLLWSEKLLFFHCCGELVHNHQCGYPGFHAIRHPGGVLYGRLATHHRGAGAHIASTFAGFVPIYWNGFRRR